MAYMDERRKKIREYLIQKESVVSSRELAEKFEVSRNTVVKDIQSFSDDVNIVRGKYGGYRFIGELTVEISEREAQALLPVINLHRNEFSEELYYSIYAKLKSVDRKRR